MSHILIVEDEYKMALSLEKGLHKYGFETTIVSDGFEARIQDISNYDLVILDWMLPGFSGIDILKEWRSKGINTPVLMLTAKSELNDITYGLDLGADDYMSKFFNWGELLSRIKALIRRTKVDSILQLENIFWDKNNHQFLENGVRVNLTPTEYNILARFFEKPHQLITRTNLIRSVYDQASNPFSNVIERHIKSIRQKFQYDPIQTVYGFGYRLRFIEAVSKSKN